MILVRGRNSDDTRALMKIFDGVEGMTACDSVTDEEQQIGLLVTRSMSASSLLSDLPVDLAVPVLVVAESQREAVDAVLSGAGDAVLSGAGRDEMRLRAELLLKPLLGSSCTSAVFNRILRTELGRSGREGSELSLVSASIGSQTNPWSLSESLSSSIRSTDTPGVSADGRVVLLLPCTTPEKATVVVKRLRAILVAQGLGCAFKLAGGRIGNLTPTEALRLLAEAPELP
jgi:hypothetical protein